MELIERDEFLVSLETAFQHLKTGEGHCIFVSGEAGIGKTSLVNAFCKKVKNRCNIYKGTCDALFAPRPLAPVYDILLQIRGDFLPGDNNITDRTTFFIKIFYELKSQHEASLIIFEDIHWADEATLDFIKFLARRITQLCCLFILTCRDNEIHSNHPLRNVLGHLNPDALTRMQLFPLSKQAVEKMAAGKEYKGEDVYNISGGNPFYVKEILASYSPGVPDNIKDSILSVYNRLDEKTRQLWQILSVLPTGFEIKYLQKMDSEYITPIQNCLDLKIMIAKNGVIFFKHELYRRAIEDFLSPLLRIALNKEILDKFRESFEYDKQIERIIHHAKNANEYELVVKYAPLAARQAASAGAHIEASKLYLSAIEYYQGTDKDILIQFYEAYAYECYLTNQMKEAIIYTEKALHLLKEKNEMEKMGNCMRFLSRLWWFNANRKKAEAYASEAIKVLADQPVSRAKAMAFSNMSQLEMLSDHSANCIFWGEQAIAMAQEIADDEILCHALNNVGDVQMRIPSSKQKGIALLQKSLDIALKNSFHEHVARAYTNLESSGRAVNDYKFAKEVLEAGIQYCEERDLDSWTLYLLADKALLNLKMGYWDEAYNVARNLINNEEWSPILKIGSLVVIATIKMRREDTDVLPLLTEALEIAFEAKELQRIIPVMVALLEYEWITGKHFIEMEAVDATITMVEQMGNVYDNSEFAFWLLKARKQQIRLSEFYEGYDMHNKAKALKAADLWERSACPYERALALFEGSEADKKKAVEIIHNLGAGAAYEKMKLEMRAAGIKSIPRGIRESTRSHPANLTDREVDVLQLLKEGLLNKEIAERLFISPKTVEHHISSIYFKLNVNSRTRAVKEALNKGIIK
jgi:DNA-binding CsgD family transcriptional regulator/predicted ATPase